MPEFSSFVGEPPRDMDLLRRDAFGVLPDHLVGNVAGRTVGSGARPQRHVPMFLSMGNYEPDSASAADITTTGATEAWDRLQTQVRRQGHRLGEGGDHFEKKTFFVFVSVPLHCASVFDSLTVLLTFLDGTLTRTGPDSGSGNVRGPLHCCSTIQVQCNCKISQKLDRNDNINKPFISYTLPPALNQIKSD